MDAGVGIEAVGLVFTGGVLLAFAAAASWLAPPLALDSRDVLLVALGAAGAVLAGLGGRKLNGAFRRTM